MINELDTVRLMKPIDAAGVAVGDVGTVVHVYSTPRLAFEVEFSNDEGETIAMLPLTQDFLSMVKRFQANQPLVVVA